MDRIKRLFLFFIFLCFSFSIFGWGKPTHMIITQIANDHLTSDAKAKIASMVAIMSVEDRGSNHYDNFLDMSHWPDDLREEKISIFDPLHFEDHYFSLDKTPLPKDHNPENVAWGVEQLEATVANDNANIYDRARSLALFMHFVEDAHQPMHCVSLVSHGHPDGDRGGNDYTISYTMPDGKHIKNLHVLWDGALTLYSSKGFPDYPLDTSTIQQIASVIQTDYPESYFGDKTKDLNPEDWTENSFEIAKDDAYQVSEGKTPSDQYIQDNDKIAEQQLALAGYRLANLLNQLL